MSTSASANASETNQPAQPAATPDPMEAVLRQAAQNMDEGKDVTEEDLRPPSTAKEDASKKTASTGSEQKPGSEPPSKKDDATAKKDEPKPGEKKPGEQEQQQQGSNYDKAKKDAERLDRSWKSYQQKEEALKQREAELNRREQEVQQRAQRGTERQQTGPVKDKDGYTAQQWEDAAAKWEAAGKYDLADGAKEQAKVLREQEKAGAQRGGGEADRGDARPQARPEDTPRTPEFQAKWNGYLAELKAKPEFADLGNKESELFKKTAAILSNDTRFSMFNDGILMAANFARAQLEAGSVPGLRKQLEEQNQELEKLRKATSPAAGGAEERGKPKAMEDMSPAEMEAHLRKQAEEHDNG